VITGGGNLPARHVIHAVGPIWAGGTRNERATLASCYRVSIQLADEHQLRSISFPAISTGVFGYPLQQAAEVAVQAALQVLPKTKHLRQVRFVLFDREALTAYVAAAHKVAAERGYRFDSEKQ
jgi:O-acetyl-ADP-ribose deacetylase (regulator of RNase III)